MENNISILENKITTLKAKLAVIPKHKFSFHTALTDNIMDYFAKADGDILKSVVKYGETARAMIFILNKKGEDINLFDYRFRLIENTQGKKDKEIRSKELKNGIDINAEGKIDIDITPIIKASEEEHNKDKPHMPRFFYFILERSQKDKKDFDEKYTYPEGYKLDKKNDDLIIELEDDAITKDDIVKERENLLAQCLWLPQINNLPRLGREEVVPIIYLPQKNEDGTAKTEEQIKAEQEEIQNVINANLRNQTAREDNEKVLKKNPYYYTQLKVALESERQNKSLENVSPVIIGEVLVEKKKGKNGNCVCEERIRAFMQMIRVPEGTEGEIGYETIFGKTSFIKDHKKGWNEHPRIAIPYKNSTSDAAGAYQIMGYTYDGIKTHFDKYGINDFTPESQDKMCMVILKHNRKGILTLILNSRIKDALTQFGSWEWASLPPGRYGQPSITMDRALELYDTYYEQEIQGKTDLHIKDGFLEYFGGYCCCQKQTEQIINDDFIQIIFNPGIDSSVLSNNSLNLIKKISELSNNSKVIITSTIRTPRRQAEIMFEQTETLGMTNQMSLYGKGGKEVLEVYSAKKNAKLGNEDVIKAMENKINEIGAEIVSRHCGDPNERNVFDIATSSLSNPKDFLSEARKLEGINIFKLINETDRGCYHIEILQ